MQVQIKQSFRVTGSPRPLLPNELVTVSDDVGREWIAQGKAVQFIGETAGPAPFVGDPVPARRRRVEKAVKAT
jgi:hypothetical protein